MRGRCFADREAPRSADGQAGAARGRRRQADKVPAHQIGIAGETSVNLQVTIRGNRGKRMAASDDKIPKRGAGRPRKAFAPNRYYFCPYKKHSSADSRQNNDFASRLLVDRAHREANCHKASQRLAAAINARPRSHRRSRMTDARLPIPNDDVRNLIFCERENVPRCLPSSG
jgi:hypothetical protein